ncbi:MAG: aminotransferase class IV [Acidaminococcaceae bacterium]
MKENLVLINGKITELRENTVALCNRGHLFGDGVFEMVAVYNGRCFALLPHMANLFDSAIGIKIPGIYTVEELVEFHEALIMATGLENGLIYTQITRGEAPYGLEFPEMMVPQLTMFALEEDRNELRNKQLTGVNLITEPDLRWQHCDINTINRLPEVLAKQKARVAKAFDTLFIRENGKITETTESNFMLVKDDIIWTHPANSLIHHGIVRRLIKERLAPDLDMQVIEKAFDLDFALTAEEIFLAGTQAEIMPVNKIDRKFVADKKVGAITRKLQTAFHEFIAKECPVK